MRVCLLLAVLWAPVVHADVFDDPYVSVQGTGQVSAKPDGARFSVGVETVADSAEKALASNSKKMRQLLAQLKRQSIASSDLQTSSFSVRPNYTPYKAKVRKIVNYTVSNTVYVTVRDLGKLGAILDRALKSGGNRLNNVSFFLKEEQKKRDEARTLAIARAKEKADIYAKAAGRRVGRALVITEANTPAPHARSFAMAKLGSAESVPVESGSMDVRVSVSVTYALK